jgi:hypothetical protein
MDIEVVRDRDHVAAWVAAEPRVGCLRGGEEVSEAADGGANVSHPSRRAKPGHDGTARIDAGHPHWRDLDDGSEPARSSDLDPDHVQA